MRVNLILPPVNLTGGVRVLAVYAQKLRERGHHVTVVFPARNRPPLWRAAARWVRGRGWHRGPRRLPSHFDGLDLDLRMLETYRPVVDADVPDGDVVVATWWETAPWVAELSPSKGAKAYFVQDYAASGQNLDEEPQTWRLPMHLFTISGYLRDQIFEHTGIRPPVIGNGVDLDRFNGPPRQRNPRFTVGHLYRTVPTKGSDIAAEAVRLAQQKMPQLRFVGFSDRRPQNAPPAVAAGEFTWGLRDREISDIYRACDAWLFTSRREGYGLPILEAMACRTPVIATPAGAAPELLASGGGELVPHEDPQAVADIILRWAQLPPDRWQAMSAAARATAERHSWDDAALRFEEQLVAAINANPSTRLCA